MKKLYLSAMLAFGICQAFAGTSLANGIVPPVNKTQAEAVVQSVPNCTLLTPVAATTTSGNGALAIDANGATRWESDATDAQSLTVDFGVPSDINTITIDWETANAKDYYLRGSLDGTTWVDIVYKTDMPAGPRTDIIDGIDAQYRYIKMDGVTRNTAYGYSIYELNVCSTAILPPDCTTVAAASATATSGNAAAAIDGNEGTRWESEATDPQTLTVDMGAMTDIKKVTIHWETANAKDYTLSGSEDGSTWTEIGAYVDMAAGDRTDIIEDIDATYRYLKVDGTARNTNYGYSIFEFTVCTPIVVEPFECDALEIASATATTGDAAQAIDGDGGSRWESTAADPQSITVDLGALANVNAVTIDWETANAKDYVLRGSVDGTTWDDIATKNNMPEGVRTDIIEDINAQYQYIKMDGVTRNTPYGYSIYELKVCGTVIIPPVPCDMLPIVAATATTGDASLAVDGIPGSRWESAFEDPQSITVDLGEALTVNAVTIDWEAANAKDYFLRGSVDGTTWVDIAEKTNMPTGERTDIIEGIAAEYRYIKMDGVSRNIPYGYSIYEFKVCGQLPVIPVVYVPVPAVIQAEDFYAMEGVQTEASEDTGGGEDVGYIDTNDWMDYNITVTTAGQYDIDLRVASNEATGNIQLLSNGTSLGTVAVPNTGGWQSWQTVTTTVTLPAGDQTFRVFAAAAPFNFNWFEVKEHEVAGTKDFVKSGIAVYPNPAHSLVNIELQNDGKMYIYNTVGALVQELDAKAGTNTVSLTNYAAGLYIIKADNKVVRLLVK